MQKAVRQDRRSASLTVIRRRRLPFGDQRNAPDAALILLKRVLVVPKEEVVAPSSWL
jgi:hypothetical protein